MKTTRIETDMAARTEAGETHDDDDDDGVRRGRYAIAIEAENAG